MTDRIHLDVKATFGLACEWDCWDCGKMADEWSHQPGTKKVVSNYYPRCHKCHKKLDKVRSKLDDDQRAKIKELWSTGKWTKTELGNMFGVHRTTITNLLKGYTYE